MLAWTGPQTVSGKIVHYNVFIHLLTGDASADKKIVAIQTQAKVGVGYLCSLHETENKTVFYVLLFEAQTLVKPLTGGTIDRTGYQE